jgi:hypothetical protein
MLMERMEIVRQALVELGDAPSQELSSFIEQKYGVKIEPKYVPLFKATIRDLEHPTRLRQSAKKEQTSATA